MMKQLTIFDIKVKPTDDEILHKLFTKIGFRPEVIKQNSVIQPELNVYTFFDNQTRWIILPLRNFTEFGENYALMLFRDRITDDYGVLPGYVQFESLSALWRGADDFCYKVTRFIRRKQ